MEWAYLTGILVGIIGMAIIDWRYKLAFWRNRRRTVMTVLVAMAIFAVWDALGIMLGVFQHGGSRYSLPFTIAPEFPVEELFFLCLLCYCTLVIYNGVLWWRSRI